MGGLAEKVENAVKKVGTALRKAFNWLIGKKKDKIEDKVINVIHTNETKINKAINKPDTCKTIAIMTTNNELKKSALKNFNKLTSHDQELVRGLYDIEFQKEMGLINNSYKYGGKRNYYYNLNRNEYDPEISQTFYDKEFQKEKRFIGYNPKYEKKRDYYKVYRDEYQYFPKLEMNPQMQINKSFYHSKYNDEEYCQKIPNKYNYDNYFDYL